jgi:hypothetical protein
MRASIDRNALKASCGAASSVFALSRKSHARNARAHAFANDAHRFAAEFFGVAKRQNGV